jgi:hypothetical protein
LRVAASAVNPARSRRCRGITHIVLAGSANGRAVLSRPGERIEIL